MDALAGTDFDYLSMIKRICVYDDCLWVHLHKQLIKAAEVSLWIKAELPAITIKQLYILTATPTIWMSERCRL